MDIFYPISPQDLAGYYSEKALLRIYSLQVISTRSCSHYFNIIIPINIAKLENQFFKQCPPYPVPPAPPAT